MILSLLMTTPELPLSREMTGRTGIWESILFCGGAKAFSHGQDPQRSCGLANGKVEIAGLSDGIGRWVQIGLAKEQGRDTARLAETCMCFHEA